MSLDRILNEWMMMWSSDRLKDSHTCCKKSAIFSKWRRICLPVEWPLGCQKKNILFQEPIVRFLSVTLVACHMPATQKVRRACQKRFAKTVSLGMQMYLIHHCCSIWKLRRFKSKISNKYSSFTGAMRGSSESKFLNFFTYMNITDILLRRKANWMGHILHRNCPINTLFKQT